MLTNPCFAKKGLEGQRTSAISVFSRQAYVIEEGVPWRVSA
jgi:hypothetical protein